MSTGKANTTHYNWHLFGDQVKNKTQRGMAILISKSFSADVLRISEITENITILHLKEGDDNVQKINIYMPGDQRGPEEFNKLVIHILTQKKNIHTIVLGDVNAHIGHKDLTLSDRQLIGTNLFHENYNESRAELKN